MEFDNCTCNFDMSGFENRGHCSIKFGNKIIFEYDYNTKKMETKLGDCTYKAKSIFDGIKDSLDKEVVRDLDLTMTTEKTITSARSIYGDRFEIVLNRAVDKTTVSRCVTSLIKHINARSIGVGECEIKGYAKAKWRKATSLRSDEFFELFRA